VFIVHYDGNPLPVVVDRNELLLSVDDNFDFSLSLAADTVVCCIHQDFVEDLLEAGCERDTALLHLLFSIGHP